MRAHFTVTVIGLLSAALLAGCQEQATDPIGPQFHHDKGGHATDGGKTKVAYQVDAVPHDACSVGDPATLASTRPGLTNETTLSVKWETDAIVVTPAGAAYSLTDEASLSVWRKGGTVESVRLWIQDVAGADGIMHSTDDMVLDPQVDQSASGFTVHVHEPAVRVWRHRGHTGGPQLEVIGTICVGDFVFTPAP